MYASDDDDKGVLFYETVISLRWQAHTVIECVPLGTPYIDDAPAYFRESILTSEGEWTQHRKLIDLGARPGGFRRAMVPNLPYFVVMFDYRGEKGYGHVIEGEAGRGGKRGEGMDEEEGDEDRGSEFPK